jgi:4,5-DOPA dioxygenase extradiol
MMKMPIVFVGHGSPMNAIEDTKFSKAWYELGKKLPKPKAILAISAHWYTDGTRIQSAAKPKQVYDMYGFPKALYEVKYPVQGDLALTKRVQELIKEGLKVDDTWGIDHGSWAILNKMYPNADVPVVQLSVDGHKSPAEHYALGKKLAALREEGVLIFASGDIVHNLGMIDWDSDAGYEWADEFDNYIRDKILQKDHEAVVNYTSQGEKARFAAPTPEHFLPVLYALGASSSEDKIEVFNDYRTMGSLSMTGFLWA